MLALSSAHVPDPAGRLAPAVAVAARLGFRRLFAAALPSDDAAARAVLDRAGVSVVAVAAPPLDGSPAPQALAPALEAALRLGTNRVVVDPGPAGRDGIEPSVRRLCRALHALSTREPGLALAVRHRDGAGGLLGFVEAEWVLDDLRGRGVGLWLDPASCLAQQRRGEGPDPLDWADRYASRVAGVSIHGLGTGTGHARPEEDGPDWGTLRASLPSEAARVLDVGPGVAASGVVESRRWLERLGW